ncbi:MAG: PDZ domain-containing protein [Elusimicrobiales bacterium]|nr:PDZ domain-containing protein [Elusimicrobiales bacterium]
MIKARRLFAVTVIAMFIGISFPYLNHAMDKTYEGLKILIDVMTLIRNNYVEEVEPKKLIYGAAKGMTASLDDYSVFMEPDEYERIKSDTDGEFGGLGIRVEVRDGWLTVATPMPGTPAWKAKIMPGDRIVKIDGVSTKDQTLEDSVKKMRGIPGTVIKITISRAEDSEGKKRTEKELVMKREIIISDNVKWHMIDDKVGYIKIVEFTGHVTEDFHKAMKDMLAKGMDSLILDLRYNPGGLLTGAIDISKMFIGDKKMIVYTKGRRKENYQEFRAGSKAPYPDIPLAVLVNRFSASSSEIVSGALQDHKRALIIGERSFGKASVQSMIPLSDKSALKITVAKYYTPNGRSILRDVKNKTGGIVPDFTVTQTLEKEKQLLLQEQKEDIHYPDESLAKKTDKKAASSDKAGSKNNGISKKSAKEEKVKDEVIIRASELLRARDVLGKLSQMNKETKDGSKSEEKKENSAAENGDKDKKSSK